MLALPSGIPIRFDFTRATGVRQGSSFIPLHVDVRLFQRRSVKTPLFLPRERSRRACEKAVAAAGGSCLGSSHPTLPRRVCVRRPHQPRSLLGNESSQLSPLSRQFGHSGSLEILHEF